MKKNVLLVDDDKISNFINSKVLSRLGLVREIHTAINGLDALEHIKDQYKEGILEVIFVDLNMPVMDGFQFIEAFLKLDDAITSKAKLVIVTSSEAIEDIRRAKQLGIKNYLIKPIQEEDVLRIFNQL